MPVEGLEWYDTTEEFLFGGLNEPATTEANLPASPRLPAGEPARYAEFDANAETSPASLAEQLEAEQKAFPLSILTPEQSLRGLAEKEGATETYPLLDHQRGSSAAPYAEEAPASPVDPLVGGTLDSPGSRGDPPSDVSGDRTPVEHGARSPADEESVPFGTLPVAPDPSQEPETPTLEVIQEVREQIAGRDDSPTPTPSLPPEVEETPLCATSEERPTSEKSPTTGASPAPSEAPEDRADDPPVAEETEAPASTPSPDDEAQDEDQCGECDPLETLGRASMGYRAVQKGLAPGRGHPGQNSRGPLCRVGSKRGG